MVCYKKLFFNYDDDFFPSIRRIYYFALDTYIYFPLHAILLSRVGIPR